jgi:UDP-N-acetylglucosamine:LPS N-acetylglucosamine transferase
VLADASKTVSEAMVLLAPTVHISCVKICTISKQTENELSLEPQNLGVLLGASKMTSELMVRLAQTISDLMVHLAQTIHLSFNEIPDDPHHLGVPSAASKIVSEAMVRLAQTLHVSCVKISTISKQTQMSFHLGLAT